MTTTEHRSPPPSTYKPISIASGMRAAACRTPAKIALREGERQLSFADLADRTARFSAVVAGKLGLGRGDNIALIAPNCLEYLEIVMGASSAGVAVATLSPYLAPPEVKYICDDCNAKALVVHRALEEKLRSVEFASVKEIIVLGRNYDELCSAAKPLPEVALSEWDGFAIPYTSGTTGEPKGVVLSHRSRVMTFFAMAVEYGCYSPDDRCLATAPLCHGAGFVFAAAAVFFGGYCEILPWFDPELIIRKLHQEELSSTFMVPTHFHAVFDLEQRLLEKYRSPPVRSIISNAAPLPQSTKERIVDYFGDDVLHETYGSTEAGIVTNLRPADQLTKTNCVGQPFIATEIKLLDSDGVQVQPGETGELFSTSPYLFNEYWNRPAEMQRTFRDGWVSAGDLAKVDGDGFVYLVDRKNDMIITGGVNVYPREIEQALCRHAMVQEAAVIGVKDDLLGESVRAFIVVRPESKLIVDDVIAHCRGELATYKIPSSVEFIKNLPRNSNGKLVKRLLSG